MSASPIELPGRTVPVPLSEAPLPDAVRVPASLSTAVESLAAMDANAVKVREVAVRLLTEHAAALPMLLAVRTEATQERARLALQPKTAADARAWAQALGAEVAVSVEDEADGYRGVRAVAEVTVDSVEVRIGSYQPFSPAQWAERSAKSVAS